MAILQLIEPEVKNLGGSFARRSLPYPNRQMVGPFIFFDHLGPLVIPPNQGIDVRPHPYINLA
ncbi:pirin family protein [Nostoc sp. WHI]|uniref:pirin family protein n=1 Tax=Nostoc sp. WHI TaxID=2650611 RepID=UPI001E465FEC|nr:pirin family protein [Nostoc sp. WHI]